jgi:hypothetical protein
MKNLCLVLDIDETILHYDPKKSKKPPTREPKYIYDADGELAEIYGLMYGDDELFFRPGFWKFIKYVKSQNSETASQKSKRNDSRSDDSISDESRRNDSRRNDSRRNDSISDDSRSDDSRSDDSRRNGLSPRNETRRNGLSSRNNDRILLGIWTFGTRGYLNALRPYLGDSFAFFHTLEDMKEGKLRLDKQLDYVIEKNNMPFNKSLPLPPNIFLVDNRPENIYHKINRNNGIIVESFHGHNPRDTMFQNLQDICDGLLKTSRMPNQYIKRFNIKGEEIPIACIGFRFDGPYGEPGGLVPIRQRSKSIRKSRSRGGSKPNGDTKPNKRKQNYTKKMK